MTDQRRIRTLVEAVTQRPGYIRAAGTRVITAEPGYVEMALDRRPDLLQANGFFHGGVIAGLADHAAGAAVTTALRDGRFAITVNLQINYLTPADGVTLIARARALQVGKTLGVAQVELMTTRGEAEHCCAIALVTLRAVDMPSHVSGGSAGGGSDNGPAGTHIR